MPTQLSEQEFKAVLPAKLKKSVNPALMQGINRVLSDPATLDFLKDNILGYTTVLQDGRFKLVNYLNAVHYVSYKLMGATNQQAYIKTFPDKYQRWLQEGVTERNMSAYASVYNKTKLVTMIFEQTLVPVHILNASTFQEAINVQAELMRTANSEMVRTTAANALLTHLKPPESVKLELDIGPKTSTLVQELQETTRQLAQQQKRAIENGTHSAKEIAELPVLEAKVIEDE